MAFESGGDIYCASAAQMFKVPVEKNGMNGHLQQKGKILVVTDPPYNVNYEGAAGKIKNDNMGNEAFYTFLPAAFTNAEAVMAQDASIYVFHADTEGLNFRKAFSDAGFQLSGCCIWKKLSLAALHTNGSTSLCCSAGRRDIWNGRRRSELHIPKSYAR